MYLLIFSVIFSLFVINSASLTDRGAFNWKSKGTSVSSRIAGGNGGVTVNSGSVSLQQSWQPRVYLMSSTSSYYRLTGLTGNTICFTVDLTQSTCNCNAAFYLVQMPSSAQPGDYCDAQGSGSTLCDEIDLCEANTHAFQATPHWGDGSNYGKWGCAWNIKAAQGYGPGGSLIDTTKSFEVQFAFTTSSSGTLNGMKIHLTQSGKPGISNTITDSSCTWMTSNYISSMASAVKSGLWVLTCSYWSGGMNWLDGCSNGATCPSGSTVTFSGLQLNSGITAIASDQTSNGNDLPFVQSPVFIGIMCAIGLLLLIGIIAFILIKRKNALNQEIV